MPNSISEEQFYHLLSLKLSGDATSDDLALLQDQLGLHPEWQFLYDQMMKPAPGAEVSPDHTNQAYAAHITKMQLKGMLAEETGMTPMLQTSGGLKRMRRVYVYAVAASLFGLFIGLQLLSHRHPESTPSSSNEIVTQKGSKSTIKLPDGTQVWLNADSKLTYNQNFGEANREVYLVGEAYFDVDHDGEHPFMIHAGKQVIKVLGTAFDVRNYPDDKFSETTLMRGKIEVVLAGHEDRGILLRPFEKLTVSKEKDSFYTADISPLPVLSASQRTARSPAKDLVLKNDSVIAETAWLLDKMVFVNERLGKIAVELERHFAITVKFNNPKVEEFRYTGVFDNISLEKILTILQQSRKITYKISGKNLTID